MNFGKGAAHCLSDGIRSGEVLQKAARAFEVLAVAKALTAKLLDISSCNKIEIGPSNSEKRNCSIRLKFEKFWSPGFKRN